MSTQQSAQERAAAFAYKHHCESEYNSRTDDLEDAFLAGEISGHQLAMEEMADKLVHSSRAPLLAKIAELEAKQAELSMHVLVPFDEYESHQALTANLEAQNKKLGDVVLEMAKAVDGNEEYKKWLGINLDSHFSKDILTFIKQLKQEREELK